MRDEYDTSVEDIDPSDLARGPDQPTPEAASASKPLTEEEEFDEEEEERFAQSERDPARKHAASERRKRLFKAGIRFYIDSSDDDDNECKRQSRTQEREKRLEAYRLRAPPGPEDPSWEVRLELKKQNMIFDDMKQRGEDKKQHWHMRETPVIVPEQYLAFRFPDPIWDINYGEATNILPSTLQIYSLKLITHEENYPLSVFGELRMHCTEDFGPQVIFSRDRDHCQTITKEEPYLLLTGPYCNPEAPPYSNELIESDLRLKGDTQSDDRYLSLFAKCDEKSTANIEVFRTPDVYIDPNDRDQRHVSACCKKEGKPCICNDLEIGQHYLLEMTHSIVTYSVVANIYIRGTPYVLLTGGYFFTACTEESSCDDMKVVLLDCPDGKEVPIVDKHNFVLSRQTICVDTRGILTVYIEHDKKGKELKFNPQLGDKNTQNVDIGSSTLEVEVEWSVFWEKYRKMFYSEL